MTSRGWAWLWGLSLLNELALTTFTLVNGGWPWVAAVLAMSAGWSAHALTVELMRGRR
jgi:hypothetical protein